MKINKLNVEFEYNFELFALISSAKDYKLAWHLNKILNLHLCKTEDLIIEFLHKSKIYISNFTFDKEYSSFRLLKNKACEFENVPKPYLVPELKEYDYLLMLHDEAGEWDLEQITVLLKNISVIQYLIKVNPENLKSKENLIFN